MDFSRGDGLSQTSFVGQVITETQQCPPLLIISCLYQVLEVYTV